MLDFSRKNLAAFWDRVSEFFGPRKFWNAPTTLYYAKREIEILTKWCLPLAEKRVLKIDLWNEAINTGIMFWVSKQHAEIYGIDISPKVVQMARSNFALKQLRYYELKTGDVRDIPYNDQSFDLVYSMGTIEHFPEFDKAIDEVHRILKPGGIAIIGTPNIYNLSLTPICLVSQLLQKMKKYPYGYEKGYSTTYLETTIRQKGFIETDYTSIILYPWILRFLDLFVHIRNNNNHYSKRAIKTILRFFDFLETNGDLFRKFGQLAVVKGKKSEE